MSQYYSYINWPKLPDDFIQPMIEYEKQVNDPYVSNYLDVGHYSDYGLVKHELFRVPLLIETWCRNNLPIDDRHTVALQRFSIPMIKQFNIGRHVDSNRREAINCVITPTGPITRWFDGNRVVESTTITPFRWIKLQVHVPHDVIDVDTKRASLSIYIPPK
jgi:hypothetical protein